MDYTLSNSYDTDAGTGQRMHEDAKVIPTVVSGKDMNSLLWSFMELLKAASLAGTQFDRATPATYRKVLQAIKLISALVGTDTGAANAVVVNYDPVVPALSDGLVMWFSAAATNTGAATLNVNGLGAKPIVGGAHSALQGGEIVAGGKCQVVWSVILSAFVLIECTGAALQVAAATKSLHAVQLGQVSGRLVGLSVFPGTAVWNRGTVKFVVSEIYGAGGGGGGTAATGAGQIAAAGGGGGGGYSMKLIATPGATEVMSLGAAGVGTSGNGVGGTGGTSSFGSWHTATGGSGGGGCPSGAQGNVAGGAGGAGGVGVGGDVNLRGGAGGASFASTASGALGGVSGYGGTTAKGSGGVAGITGTGAGAAGATGGGGGAGAFGYNGAGQQGGGSGSGGYGIVWEYA